MANELVLVSSRDDDDRDSKHDSHNQLGIELDAMAAIGRALDSIEDPVLRQRVLNWAVERWGSERSRVTGVAALSAPTVASLATDPGLAVDSLGELFGDRPAEARPGPAPEILELEPEAPPAKAPVETMLQSLAADFQRLAAEWNGDAKA
jgi:hypothetical protein